MLHGAWQARQQPGEVDLAGDGGPDRGGGADRGGEPRGVDRDGGADAAGVLVGQAGRRGGFWQRLSAWPWVRAMEAARAASDGGGFDGLVGEGDPAAGDDQGQEQAQGGGEDDDLDDGGTALRSLAEACAVVAGVRSSGQPLHGR
jgi:hypothetical protein